MSLPPLTSSTARPTENRSTDEVGVTRLLTATVSRVLQSIAARWPIQAKSWPTRQDLVAEWCAAVVETQFSPQKLTRAYERFLASGNAGAYPPGIHEILSYLYPTPEEAESSLRKVINTLSHPDTSERYDLFSPEEYFAFRSFGHHARLDLTRGTVNALLPRWNALLRKAATMDDLPNPPPYTPVPKIARQNSKQTALEALAKMKAVLR